MNNFWSGATTVGAAAVAGGVGAELSGGDFWRGAALSGLVAGFNHAAHRAQRAFYDAQLKKMFDVYKNSYSDSPTPPEFYQSVGGPLGEWAAENPEQFLNTCAARMSKALNYSGSEIPKGTPGSYLGGDGKYYFIRANEMHNYLSKIWKSPLLLKSGHALKNAVYSQKGFGGGVTGHIDIIYRGTPAHEFYPSKTYYWH